jgi:adenine phosphoribosyltransferase
MVEHFREQAPTLVLGIESRGFLFATPVAHRLGAGFIPARKPGKLPWRTTRIEYDLEYGTDALEVHEDACGVGDRVLIVDDLLATGGTARAACDLVRGSGAELVGVCVAVELVDLGGRARGPRPPRRHAANRSSASHFPPSDSFRPPCLPPIRRKA